jgi:hypothetical protein
MAKPDYVPSAYPCLMQKDHLRRVSHPHDERIVIGRRRVRRALAKLARAVRA